MDISQSLNLFWVTNSSRSYASSRSPSVPVYRVGEPLQRGRRQWPAGAQYSYGRCGHELTLFHPEPDARLVHDVKNGEPEFAAIIRLPVIVFAYRFGESLPWEDVPYCWHLQSASHRLTPPLESSLEFRALLWVTLVGAHDGIIYAQRGITLAPEFTRVLHRGLRTQAQARFDADDCISGVADLMVAHPTTLSRLPLAQARTIGNQ